MKTISFDLKGCPGTTPEPITVPEIQCVAVDEIKAAEAKPGGRSVLVTPYGEAGCCSGQYGQWQVLTGFGGQINRGIYCGDSFTKEYGYNSPGVSSKVDCNDKVYNGTKCLAIRERGRWFVFCPKGGGGGQTTLFAKVVGGNAIPVTVDPTDPDNITKMTFPTVKNYSFPLPVSMVVDGSPLCPSLPVVPDWSTYTLDWSFTAGSTLPRLPDGLCYVEIQRPYAFNGAAWDAYKPCEGSPSALGKPGVSSIYVDPLDDASKIVIKWNTVATLVSPPLTSSSFTVTTTSATPLHTVSAAFDGTAMTMTLTMNRDLASDESVTVVVAQNLVQSNDSPPLTNDTYSGVVAARTYSGTILIAMNRVSSQLYTRGELVEVSETLTTITDSKGVSKSVPEILCAVGNNTVTRTYASSYYFGV